MGAKWVYHAPPTPQDPLYFLTVIKKHPDSFPKKSVTNNVIWSYIIRYQQKFGDCCFCDYCFCQIPMTYTYAKP